MGAIHDIELREVAHDVFGNASADPVGWANLKAAGVDLDAITNLVGPIVRRRCHIENGFFDLDTGQMAYIMSVLDDDAETLVDLIAWYTDDPTRFGVYAGAVPLLGIDQVANPASWAFGSQLRVHRCPLDWLRAGCSGIVILDHVWAGPVLYRRLGKLLAEDADHARDLRDMLCVPPVNPGDILFPLIQQRSAA